MLLVSVVKKIGLEFGVFVKYDAYVANSIKKLYFGDDDAIFMTS